MAKTDPAVRDTDISKFVNSAQVGGIEPMNGTVEGRDKDRARGLLDTLEAGGRKTYRYRIEVVAGRDRIESLRRLNGK